MLRSLEMDLCNGLFDALKSLMERQEQPNTLLHAHVDDLKRWKRLHLAVLVSYSPHFDLWRRCWPFGKRFEARGGHCCWIWEVEIAHVSIIRCQLVDCQGLWCQVLPESATYDQSVDLNLGRVRFIRQTRPYTPA